MPEFVPSHWNCSYCMSEYVLESDAVACEKRHMVNLKIVSTNYHRLSEYPNIISVEFEDGNRADYHQKTSPTKLFYDEDEVE